MTGSGKKNFGGRALVVVLWGGLMAMQACSAIPIFSPRVMEGVNEDFDAAVWWKTPNAVIGRKVELGGEVVQAEARSGETFLIAAHLPIVDQLVYESFEEHRVVREYGIHYRATIDPKWLEAGNHMMVVGVTSQARTVVIRGAQRTVPVVTAECVHFWKSARTPPPELPLATAEKFASLDQTTYCTSGS